ncbi:MAG: hypothetical protein ACKVQV_12875 [Bacteroidia bacterium]
MFFIQFITAVIVIIGFANWKTIKQAKLELLIYLQLISFTVEIISVFTVAYFRNNLITYNLFILLQPILMLLLIGSWNSPSFFSKILRNLSAAFFIFWVLETFIFKTIWLTTSNWSMLIGNLLLIYAFAVYLVNLSNTSTISILRSPRFWIAASYLVYCAGASVLLALNEQLKTALGINNNFPINLQFIHLTLHTFTSLLILKALHCLPTRTISLSSSSF